MRFTGKSAIVTGAANGIGKGAAIKLAAEGAQVAVVDITHSDTIKEAVNQVLKEFGKIDILVNSAGGGWKQEHVPFKDTPVNSWQWILDLNINGTLLFTHAVIDHMVERKYGRIINLSSIAAEVGLLGLAVYAATKGAIIHFTKSLAMELGPYGITVNSVSPGLVPGSSES